MKKILLLLLLAAGIVSADIIETWSCKGTDDVLVVANIDKNRETGSINAAGIEHQTKFRVKGFNRRWDFDSYKYSFIIKPDGLGLYYDFSSIEEGEKVGPSLTTECEKIEDK